jgi:transposase-like protein
MLVVADGAPGPIKAVEQCWPSSDRQHCSVHRARNLFAKLPEQERERVRRASTVHRGEASIAVSAAARVLAEARTSQFQGRSMRLGGHASTLRNR